MKHKILIGRIDKIDFPDLHLAEIDAKIDTGAYTSAIHYHHAEELVEKGKTILHFTLLDPTHPEYNGKNFYFQQYQKREIKNSFGETEERFIIATRVTLFGDTFMAEFSLSDRGNLKYPILLGRRLLQKRFVVDVSRKNLSHKQKTASNEDRHTIQK